MNSTPYKSAELFILFILLPISFTIPYAIWIKLSIGFVGFLYVIYILLKVENEKFKIAPNLNWKHFWKETLLKFLIIACLTSLFVWITNKHMLFEVVINKPIMGLFFFLCIVSFRYTHKNCFIEPSFLSDIKICLKTSYYFFLLMLFCSH